MITQTLRNQNRQRVHARIRRKMQGTAERPRLNVYRSLNQIYTQLIDDASGVTLASASSVTAKLKTGGNIAAAKEVGRLIAERGKEKGICITGASRRWRMRRAKRVSSFSGRGQEDRNGDNETEAGSRAI
jgi:large subunit ribosomal protein L18